jgi:hypothetical protein
MGDHDVCPSCGGPSLEAAREDCTTPDWSHPRAEVAEYARIVTAYDDLRKRVFEAISAEPASYLDWLHTAFRNAGASGIADIDPQPDGLHVEGECWTNTTGGSMEHWSTVVGYDRL